jgi:hypothetical protein
MTYVIAFDFESFGPIPSIHGFTQLGAIIGSLTNGHIIETFNEYANQAEYSSDPDCIESHWLKTPERYAETLDKCSDSTKHPHEVVEMFVDWISKFVKKYEKESFYLITDCSTFDSGILKTFSLCSTLKIINKKSVRDIIDTTSFYLGVSRLFMTEEIVDGNSFELACKSLGLDPEKFKSSVQHDHNPVNDSIVIFERYKFINDALGS